MNTRSHVKSLPATTSAAMVDVKEKVVVTKEVEWNGVNMSFAPKKPNKVLK